MEKKIISLVMLAAVFIFASAPGFCRQPYYYINSPSKTEKPKIVLFEKKKKPEYKVNNDWRYRNQNYNKTANSYNLFNGNMYNGYYMQKHYNYPYSVNNSNYKYNNYFRMFN